MTDPHVPYVEPQWITDFRAHVATLTRAQWLSEIDAISKELYWLRCRVKPWSPELIAEMQMLSDKSMIMKGMM